MHLGRRLVIFRITDSRQILRGAAGEHSYAGVCSVLRRSSLEGDVWRRREDYELVRGRCPRRYIRRKEEKRAAERSGEDRSVPQEC